MLVTYGQRQVAAWLGIPPNVLAQWISRYDDWPRPDSETRNPDETTRGWRPGRLPEWRAYADKRAARAVQYGKGPDRTASRKTTTRRT